MQIINCCPQCGSNLIHALHGVIVTSTDIGWTKLLTEHSCSSFNYNIMHCASCGLAFRDLRFSDSDLKILYGNSSSEEAMPLSHYWGRSQEISHWVSSKADINISDKRILDIGGGQGEISDWFVEVLNCKCDVFDYGSSNKSCKPGLNIVGEIDSNIEYDLIMCNHVLEHVNHPAEFLKPFIAHSNPNTIFYFEVPFELIHYYCFKSKGHYEHINYFSISSVYNLGLALGLNPLSVELKLGYGSSIPVISAVFDLDKSVQLNRKSFSILKDVLSPKSAWLLVESKFRQRFNLTDLSHHS